MKNIIKDIALHCPECHCSTERTIEYLIAQGDISYISEHYREVWFFYLEALKTLKNKKQARLTTLELMDVKPDKFKYIQKWAKRVSHST